jgi:hypothetical protein
MRAAYFLLFLPLPGCTYSMNLAMLVAVEVASLKPV